MLLINGCVNDVVLKGHAPTGYASFAHDAVWAYALALDKLFKAYPAGLDTIRTNQSTK